MLIIVPKNTFKAHEGKLNRAGYYENFSLLFRQYVPWRKPNYKFDEQKWQYFEQFHFDENLINQLQKRGSGVIKTFKKLGLPTYQFSMHTTWRLITGIGASSSLEVGMILHHVYGIPYIPASSIKGLLRYYLTKIEPDPELVALLGKGGDEEGEKGKIVFLDAFPQPEFDISVDIMNNHYQDYYMDDKPPADWMDPNPIKFLTVKNATFVFRLFSNSREVGVEKLEDVARQLSQALINLGIGAKTAVGYGRMEGFQPIAIVNDSEKPVQDKEEFSAPTAEPNINFYDNPDGTREYYLTRLNMAEPYSEKVQWLFQKWERDEQWKNDPEIAKAFLPKIKKQKKSGKETHFYIVIKSILNKI
ncbi:MAG: type III-B CRISPR module RAMP protein Cmr6 [Calditrichaeota bacterium]|nr:type III-B CRISPR module RAMP protein Cmr6 [Calditrichota bacterium]